MKMRLRVMAAVLAAVLTAGTAVPSGSISAAASQQTSVQMRKDADKLREWSKKLKGYSDEYRNIVGQQESAGKSPQTDQLFGKKKQESRESMRKFASGMKGSEYQEIVNQLYSLEYVSDSAYIENLDSIAGELQRYAAWKDQQADQYDYEEARKKQEEAEAAQGIADVIDSFTGSDDSEPATSGSAGDNLDWFFDKDTLRIVGDGDQLFKKLGEAIGDMFRRYTKHLFLSSSITSIGDSAFAGFISLQNISFSDDYTYEVLYTKKSAPKASDAFSRSVSSAEGAEITVIGKNAFADCVSLEEIVIPATVTSVGENAFKNCHSVSSIIIEDGATGFAENVFSGSENLTEITIPGSVGTVGAGFVKDCPNLTKIVLEEGVTEIEKGAFADNKSLTEVTIPPSVTEIDDKFVTADGKAAADQVTIRGYSGSAAEKTARKVGKKFVSEGKVEKEESEEKEEGTDKASPVTDVTEGIHVPGTSYTKTFGCKAFSLKAVAGVALKYTSGNKKVAKVSKKGKVTVKGIGTAKIRIEAAKKADAKVYKPVTVTVTVNPKGTKIRKITAKGGKVRVSWKKQSKKTTGYQLQYARDRKFKKSKKTVTIKKNKTVKKSLSRLKRGKKYYFRIRTYKKVKGKKYYSGWSKVKSVKVK